MSRASDRRQNDRLDDLDRRVMDLEGEVSVRQDHQAILQQLDMLKRQTTRLEAGLALLTDLSIAQNARLVALVDLLEPKGTLVINVGAISEIN